MPENKKEALRKMIPKLTSLVEDFECAIENEGDVVDAVACVLMDFGTLISEINLMIGNP